MNKYSVLWSRTAEKDLEATVEFIADDSVDEALSVLRKIRDKVSNLFSMPERGRVVPELRQQGIFIYRELIVPPWRIIYKISGRIVYIFAVIDSRRNAEDILLERFTR